MALIDKNELEEKRQRRIEALRQACQGQGMGESNASEVMAELAKAFGYEDDQDLFWRLWDGAGKDMPDTPFLDAFANALEYREGKNLTDRRAEYLTEHGNISARTLMRYEVEGASILVRQFELAEELHERQKEYEESEDAVRDLDMAALRRRVSDLEEQLDTAQEQLRQLDIYTDMIHSTLRTVIDAVQGKGDIQISLEQATQEQNNAWYYICERAKAASQASA